MAGKQSMKISIVTPGDMHRDMFIAPEHDPVLTPDSTQENVTVGQRALENRHSISNELYGGGDDVVVTQGTLTTREESESPDVPMGHATNGEWLYLTTNIIRDFAQSVTV